MIFFINISQKIIKILVIFIYINQNFIYKVIKIENYNNNKNDFLYYNLKNKVKFDIKIVINNDKKKKILKVKINWILKFKL